VALDLDCRLLRVSFRSRLLEFILEFIVGFLGFAAVKVVLIDDSLLGRLISFAGCPCLPPHSYRMTFSFQLQRCAFFDVVLSFCSFLIYNDLFSLAEIFLALL